MIHAVRCPNCQDLSRVGAEALGRVVACPHCQQTFAAEPDPAFAPGLSAVAAPPRAATKNPPRARRVRARAGAIPVVGTASGHRAEPVPHHGPPAVLIALVLVPLGIPLLWLVAPAFTGKEPVFSFAAPVALALGLSGLGLGIGFAHGWTLGTRVRAVIALILVGYFTGAFLYFMKKEWAEALRKHVGPGRLEWKETFEPEDKGFSVKLPGKVRPRDESALPGWELKTYRFVYADQGGKHAKGVFTLAYDVAHGTPPADLAGPKLGDDDWFEKAKAAVVAGCDGDLKGVRPVTARKGNHPGREYAIVLADGATNRIVRVYRIGPRAVYLAVEGAFVPDDADYVRAFFESFVVSE
ncbi:hypothetical protein [Fimbriiglobus ruber]|uniref:hypothetical protein n=1 Tax=Fimbriiglobus ruber TaxID=1908690 RepID=UPI000B4BD981|nr:hypothetical protein [Fimbriiglobus ruber]